jgi:hypothetical protein
VINEERFIMNISRPSIIPPLFFILLLVSSTPAHAVCISGDCNNGYGVFSWANGDEHEGDFKNGKANGQGTRKYWDGDRYIGGYKDGQKNGHGAYYWRNGDRFVGEYKNGKRNGPGKKIYADGAKWIGEWLNDKRVWQPKKDCSQLVQYGDDELYKDFEKAFDKQVLFDEANESLNKIKKDLIGDSKTWYGLAGTNDWSAVVKTIAKRLKTTINLIADFANINPVNGSTTSIAGAATTVTSLKVYEALLSNESIQRVSNEGLEITYEKLILLSSGGLGAAIRTVWNLADDIKDGVYLPENHERLKIDMDKALTSLSREFSLLERKMTAAKKRAYVVDEIKKGIDRYCDN